MCSIHSQSSEQTFLLVTRRFTWNGENIWNSIQWKLCGEVVWKLLSHRRLCLLCYLNSTGEGRVNFSKCTPRQTARVHWQVTVLFSMKRRSFFPSKSFSNGKRSKKLRRHPFPWQDIVFSSWASSGRTVSQHDVCLMATTRWHRWHRIKTFRVDQLTANLEWWSICVQQIVQENNNWRRKQNSFRKDRVVYCFFQQTKTKDRQIVCLADKLSSLEFMKARILHYSNWLLWYQPLYHHTYNYQLVASMYLLYVVGSTSFRNSASHDAWTCLGEGSGSSLTGPIFHIKKR